MICNIFVSDKKTEKSKPKKHKIYKRKVVFTVRKGQDHIEFWVSIYLDPNFFWCGGVLNLILLYPQYVGKR